MTTVAITTMMLVVAPRAALAVVACAVASTLVTVVFAHLQRGFQEHETAASVAQHNAILEMLRSIVRVKAAAAESRFVARWRALLGREMAASLRRTRAAVWPEAAATLVRDGLAAAILIWGALRARDSGVTVGALVAFLQMAAVTLAAASRLADVWGAVVTAAPQLAAAREVLAMPLPEQRSRRARAAALRVVVDDVTFRYRHDLPDVIEHVAMLIEPGETRRIEGPSGSGKSTLLRLMAGVLEPDRGSVRIAGARPSQLAGEVMYVPQFARLFSGTLAENLTLLSGGAPLPRIRAVAEELGLGTLLRTMPAGYDTMLHANGTGISSGQRQLILLTAAASSERRVLLLDEPMANLDTATQQRILAARAFAGKTIVYASHTAAW
jgi:ABC-type bacteriocin/lantibiotic exporter with double-glycine peptidase domain